jgi:hypothetical protein
MVNVKTENNYNLPLNNARGVCACVCACVCGLCACVCVCVGGWVEGNEIQTPAHLIKQLVNLLLVAVESAQSAATRVFQFALEAI